MRTAAEKNDAYYTTVFPGSIIGKHSSMKRIPQSSGDPRSQSVNPVREVPVSGFLIQVRKLVLVLLCAVRRGVWNPRVAVAIVVHLWRNFDELLGPAEFLVSVVCLMYYLLFIRYLLSTYHETDLSKFIS